MAIATVINVKGEVFAVNKEGVKRRLQKGDQLQEGEILVTAPGSSAELDMGGGKTVQVAEQQTFAVDGSVGGPAQPSAATSALESAAAAQKVIQALAAGDANALLEAEAAAAGLAGGGAADGGSSFVQLLRISEGVTGVNYEYGNFSQGRVDQPTPGAIEEITEVEEPEQPQEPEEPTRALVSIEGPGEVTEGDITTDYTVSVDQETTADLIVTLTYTGVALDGTDFTGVVQVTIPSGSSSVTFNIATLDDNLAEGSELYTVTITDLSGGGFDVVQVNPAADHVDTAIVDEVEDPTPQEALVSITGPGSVTEGSTTTDYTVSVDQETTADLIVTLTYTGVALDGTDFTGVAQVTIPSGSSSVTFNIATLVDDIAEGSELYTVTITDVSGGGFELVLIDSAADHVDTNILDDDFAPIGNPDLREVREGSIATPLATVLGNDTDADDASLSVAVFSATNSGVGSEEANGSNIITTALGGTVKMNPNGTFTYTAPVRDHGIDGSDSDGSDRDYFYYKASDGTNLSGWVLVNIDITDTGVDAVIDIQALPESGPLVGNVLTNDVPSLDTPTKVTSVNGISVPTTGDVSINGTYGVLTINSDGVYTYTKNAATVVTSDGKNNTLPAGVTMYATGSWSGLKGNTIDTSSLVAWSGVDETSGAKAGFGVKIGGGPSSIDNNEALIVTLSDATNSVSVLLGAENLNQGNPDEAHWYAYDVNGNLLNSGDFTSVFNNGNYQPLTITSTTEIKYIVFSNEGGTNSQGYVVTSITYQPSGVDSFTYAITDSDGSTDSSVLLIGDDQIITGTAGNDTALLAGIGDDILVGGGGSDSLTGGLGDDVFVWRSGDQGTGGTLAVDTIADFGNGTDKIDLRDLLQGENSGNLTDYLHFAYDGITQSTIINISTTGDVDTAVDQQIVLAAVDITNTGQLDDATIINNLLSQQKLVVDS